MSNALSSAAVSGKAASRLTSRAALSSLQVTITSVTDVASDIQYRQTHMTTSDPLHHNDVSTASNRLGPISAGVIDMASRRGSHELSPAVLSRLRCASPERRLRRWCRVAVPGNERPGEA